MESLKLLPLLLEYGPIGISLAVVAAIWFKTSKDHKETLDAIMKSHSEGMGRLADALNHANDRIGVVSRDTSEIKGIVKTNHHHIVSDRYNKP